MKHDPRRRATAPGHEASRHDALEHELFRHDPRRRAVALGAASGALLAAAGCVSLGGDAPVPIWYRLEDVGAGAVATAGGRPATLDRVLLVGPVLAPGFYDSTMVAFSRARGALSHYQFAGWAERPGRRIGTLIERRLSARGQFGAVVQSTAGVRGDLLLNVALEHLLHDVTEPPGVARIAIAGELIDWRERRLLARRVFVHSTPAAAEGAEAAVVAINVALGALLDELCPWVEASAAGAPAAVRAPA